MIKKTLQKIFKKISYSIFSKIHGKIERSISVNENDSVEATTVKVFGDIKYRVYNINKGRLYTDRIQDTAVLVDNKIIEGPSFQLRYTHDSKIYNSKIEDNIVFKNGTPRKLKNLNGSVLSLLTGGGGNNNYWHWLIDVLPRLGLYDEVGNLSEIDYFLLPDDVKKFQKQTLDCLNIPKHKRLSSRKFRHVKAKKIIVTDHPVVITGDATKDTHNIPEWIILWLRKVFLKNNTITNTEHKNKIYIDRDEENNDIQPQRLISNEDEVKRYLLKKNFTSVKLHEMNFLEQVNLFYNAKCVVGLHGAGLANVVFCKEGTKIIELRSSDAGPMYENVAKKNNLNYNSVITKAKQIYKFDHPNQQGSIDVSISNLSEVVEK